MLARRINRDVKERKRDVEGVINQWVVSYLINSVLTIIQYTRYLRFVKPAYDDFVLPASRYADIVNRLYHFVIFPLSLSLLYRSFLVWTIMSQLI